MTRVHKNSFKKPNPVGIWGFIVDFSMSTARCCQIDTEQKNLTEQRYNYFRIVL